MVCGVTKEVDEGIDKSVLRWFGHIERMGMVGLLKWYMWESVWVVAY